MAHGGQKNIKSHKDHGRRAHGPDKATRKARTKAQDPRYREAMSATQAAREQLDRIMAEQAENPAVGETPGAIYARRQAELELQTAQVIEDEYANAALQEELRLTIVPAPKPAPKLVKIESERVYVRQTHVIDTTLLPREGEGKWRFSYQTAFIMLKDGYNIKHVVKYTGIGYENLEHVPLDSEGYMIQEGDEDG